MSYLEEIQVKNLDHLGIVAGLIDEIGIVEIINNKLGIDVREKISAGTVVKSIIINGLGFVSRPLYLFSQFFQDKAIEKLLGSGIKYDYFNDDKIGRVMDELYKYGLNDIFIEVVLEVIKKFKIELKYAHLDSTSFHLDGEYKSEENQEEGEKFLKEIQSEEFEHPQAARYKLKAINKKLRLLEIKEVELIETYSKKKEKIYKMIGLVIKKDEEISRKTREAGKFILATNLVEENKLEASEILITYKNQQSTERGFRFLKDPLFFTDSFFVEKPERIETMLFLMSLCLLVYNLGQRELRNCLKRVKIGIKNQVGKVTLRPTLRWIFQGFQGIHYVILNGVKKIVNLTEERRFILSVLPASCQRYYL